MKWGYYKEENSDERGKLYSELAKIQNPDAVRVPTHNPKRIEIYHVLDATVYVDGRINPKHTIIARTVKKIQETKSRLEELTGVKLI